MSVIWIGVVGAFVTQYIIIGASLYIIMNNQIQVVNFCIKFLTGARQHSSVRFWLQILQEIERRAEQILDERGFFFLITIINYLLYCLTHGDYV